MLNKRSAYFINRIECFVAGMFSFFFSLQCYSDVKPMPNEQTKTSFFQPECAPMCEEIARIAFYFVDQNNIFTKAQKESMPNEIKDSVTLGRPDIKFVASHLDTPSRADQVLSTSIRTELVFKKNDCDTSSIRVGVRLIFRNRFFVDEFSCSYKDASSCIQNYMRKEIKTQIDDYLFNPTVSGIL